MKNENMKENNYMDQKNRKDSQQHRTTFLSGELGFQERLHNNILRFYNHPEQQRIHILTAMFFDLMPFYTEGESEQFNTGLIKLTSLTLKNDLKYKGSLFFKECQKPEFELKIKLLKQLLFVADRKNLIRNSTENTISDTFTSGELGFQERLHIYKSDLSVAKIREQIFPLRVMYVELARYFTKEEQLEIESKLIQVYHVSISKPTQENIIINNQRIKLDLMHILSSKMHELDLVLPTPKSKQRLA